MGRTDFHSRYVHLLDDVAFSTPKFSSPSAHVVSEIQRRLRRRCLRHRQINSARMLCFDVLPVRPSAPRPALSRPFQAILGGVQNKLFVAAGDCGTLLSCMPLSVGVSSRQERWLGKWTTWGMTAKWSTWVVENTQGWRPKSQQVRSPWSEKNDVSE